MGGGLEVVYAEVLDIFQSIRIYDRPVHEGVAIGLGSYEETRSRSWTDVFRAGKWVHTFDGNEQLLRTNLESIIGIGAYQPGGRI